jgi:hypothetical protein
MSLSKMNPISEILELIEVESLSLEATPAAPIAVSQRPALPNRIAVIGNYLPRHCGLATFTTDLCDAIHGEYGTTELLALPVNDTEDGYGYPARVRFELSGQSHSDGKGLALFDQQRLQRRRDASAGWFDALALSGGRSPRPFTLVRGPFGERRRRMANRS